MNICKVLLVTALLGFTTGCGVDGLPVPPSEQDTE